MFNIQEVLNVFSISIAARLFFSRKRKNKFVQGSKPRKKIPAQEMDRKNKFVQAKNVPPLPSLF